MSCCSADDASDSPHQKPPAETSGSTDELSSGEPQPQQNAPAGAAEDASMAFPTDDRTVPAGGDAPLHASEDGVVGRNLVEDDSDDSSTAEPANNDAAPELAPDPYKLRRRFIRTHRSDFPRALREIENGRKVSCWSWYIFPTAPWVVNGYERGSYTNMQYALRDLPPNNLRGDDAARAFLTFPREDGVSLRENYLKIIQEVTKQLKKGIRCVDLVGFLDDPKLRSSVKLFERISRDFDDECNRICRECLDALREKY